ncbi:MAG: hypothetical protein AB1724_16690 [Thermodesulfobacteriota bacterium]
MMKQATLLITVFLLTFIIMIAGGEFYLRYKLPYYDYANQKVHPPCQEDPVIGWTNNKNTDKLLCLSPNGKTITVTHTADGRRISSAEKLAKSDHRDQLVVVGCSMTYGYGLSDEETWPWLLQQKLPCLKVLNYGTPGYGTYHCLLMLEQVLSTLSSPKIVLYGFIEHHLIRNVATPLWWALQNPTRQKKIILPYVDIENNKLIRYPPVPVKHWPLSQSLAIVKTAEILYLQTFQDPQYFIKMDPAWQFLMTDMRDLCANHGCRLVVIILNIDHSSEKNFYKNFLELNRIEYIDADIGLRQDLLLEGDPYSHPNQKANQAWAEIINSHIFCGANGKIASGGSCPELLRFGAKD